MQRALGGALTLLLASTAAFAQDKACVELKTTAETEAEVVEQGQKVKRLVPVGKVVPGNEVVWTITARNVCDKPADNIVGFAVLDMVAPTIRAGATSRPRSSVNSVAGPLTASRRRKRPSPSMAIRACRSIATRSTA
mgnify:CR=1 FL=1